MRHILPALLSALLTLAPAPVRAACEGRDLMAALPAERAEEIRAEAAATPYAQGNHWIARKGSRTVYVIVTLHLNDPRFDAVVETLAPVVAEADVLLLESTEADMTGFQRRLAEDPSIFLIVTGPTLPEIMSEDGWQRLSALVRSRGMPAWMVAKMQPWFLSSILSIPACVHSSTQPDNGLDRRLERVADENGVPTGALEDVDSAIALFGKYDLAEQVRYLEMSLGMFGSTEDDLSTLVAAYFEERLVEGSLFLEHRGRETVEMSSSEFDAALAAFEGDLLVGRNRAWMPRILDHPGDTVVVAVGAAHLSGEDGVLQLLENAGYTLDRGPF